MVRSGLTVLVLLVCTTSAFGKTLPTCSDRLLAAPNRAPEVRSFDFDRSARLAIEKLELTQSKLLSFVPEAGLNVLTEADGFAYGIAFEPDPRGMNRGFLIRGRLFESTLEVHSVYRASVSEELEYYHRLAEVNGIESRQLDLAKAILNCASLVLQGRTQVKLRLKHRLSVDEVIEFLNASHVTPALDRVHHNVKNRFVLDEPDRHGRPMRVVVQEEGGCPNGLITAFEVR